MTHSATPVLDVRSVALGPWQTNCYVVAPACPAEAGAGVGCWIIDAGLDPEPLLDLVRARSLRPRAIVITHAHVDHIAGLARVRAEFPGVPVLIHEAEREWLADPELNLSAFAGMPVSAPPPDALLTHAQMLDLNGVEFRVLHVPGHSPGSVALHAPAAGIALVGDALFAGSVGRTDFPGSDPRTLARSIRDHLYTLPDATLAYPGHGPATTIGRERRGNPFVRA